MVNLKEEEILVTSSWKDHKKISKGSIWCVEDYDFNMDTQLVEVILRPCTINDI